MIRLPARKGAEQMAKPKNVISQIKNATRRKLSADEKIEGLRGETSISEICRREGIAASVYYKWSKSFLEAGKNGLTKDTLRKATTDEVKRLRASLLQHTNRRQMPSEEAV
jgi:transposase